MKKVEQVIDYIKKLREKADLLEKSGYATCGLVQDYRNCAEIIEKLSEQPQADKWIPCEERLPSEIGEYLVAYSNGDMTIQHFYGKVFSEIDSFNSIIACQPIAWQPLPTPYKKEGAE